MKGSLFVISGPSGVGKSTVIRRVLEKYPNMQFSVSATTRAPRPSETDGKDYYFVTKEQFTQMLEEDAFLEHARYVDNYYGTPEAPVQAALDNGIDVLLDVEAQGAFQVKAKRPQVPLIFILPPSVETLRERLKHRGDTSDEAVAGRLKQAMWEITKAKEYDFLIVNEDRDEAARQLTDIIRSVKQSEFNRTEIIDALLKEEQ